MENRLFPIQTERGAKPHPRQIPWSVAELAYSVYSAKHKGQSLERLAERGGFGPGEMDVFLPDWREKCSELVQLKNIVAIQAELISWYESDSERNLYDELPEDLLEIEERLRLAQGD